MNKSIMEAVSKFYKDRLAEEVKAGIIQRSNQKAKTPSRQAQRSLAKTN